MAIHSVCFFDGGQITLLCWQHTIFETLVGLMFEETTMATKSRNPGKTGLSDGDRFELMGSDIEFEPLEETYPDEEDSFSEMFQRLERDRSLGHDESFG